MPKRTDEELIEIVTIRKDDYEPFAVEAAFLEIEERGIDAERIKQVEVERNAMFEEENSFYSNKANRSLRFFNSIIDFMGLLALYFIFGSLFTLIIEIQTEPEITIAAYSMFFIAFLTYYITMEFYFQKTLGKFLTKTRVVTTSGEVPTLGDITKRTFCRLIPLDRLSFLLARNGFHDSFSKTTVVRDANKID